MICIPLLVTQVKSVVGLHQPHLGQRTVTFTLISLTPSPPRLATNQGQVFPYPTWRMSWNGSMLGMP